MIIMDSMDYFMGKLRIERRLWNESYTREIQMVDEILRPWVRQRISEGVRAGEMLEHESAAALLADVARWCREYAQWRIGSHLPFVESYPVESWARRGRRRGTQARPAVPRRRPRRRAG